MQTRPDSRYLAELNERLFAHFVGGAWRAPLSDRLLPVTGAAGAALGRIVCAGARDIARARGVLRQGPDPDAIDADALWAAMLAEAPLLRTIRAQEGFTDDQLTAPAPLTPAGRGPLVLLTAADTPLDRIAGALLAGAGRGMIWKPAPAAAASAHLLMRAVGPLARGRLALLQGDHATGALLAGQEAAQESGQGGLIWAGAGPLPEGLPTPLVNLAATDPCRP